MTSTQLGDLQTIASHLESQSGISSNGYVTSIFYQLSGTSQANATWTAGATGASIPLGNLAAGTPPAQLNELIGKWLLGTDLPDPTTTGATASAVILPTYQTFSPPLFGTGGAPQISDIAQGDLGDCELCAGLIEIVANSPSLVKSMIVDDGNGAYGVRFYVNGKETWVTVNGQLPVYQGGLIFNNAYAPDQSAGFWADLVEKAYAQLSADGNIGHPSANTYQNIASDNAFDILTNLTNASDVTYYMASGSNFSAKKAAVIDAVNQHDDVVLETDPNAADVTDAAGKRTLIGDHAFAVIGYDAATGNFIVRNPWGVEAGNTTQPYEVQFEVSMSDVVKVNGDFAIDNSAAPNVVITSGANVAALASTTNSSFYAASPGLSTGTTFLLAPQLQVTDAAGLAVTQYRLQLLGGIGTLQLNGGTNLATAAQQANGQIIVSSADFAKLSIAAGSSAGTLDLLIAGNDGTGWGGVSELQWTVSATPVSVLPAANPLVAPLAGIPLTSLFQISGTQPDSYFLQIESGGGIINLNGAKDLLGGGGGGLVKVSTADLAKITYTASGNSGIAIIDVTASAGGVSSKLAQVPVDVGYSVAAALHAFDQGQTPYQIGIADSAANIFGNIGHLEQMVPNWNLLGVVMTDTTTPTATISYADFTNDQGLLSLIHGNYNLVITGVPAAQLASVEAQPHVLGPGISASAAYVFANFSSLESQIDSKQLAGITVFDDGTPGLSLSVATSKSYAGVIGATSGYRWVVSDSSANVISGLDGLESLAKAGKISIALTDAAPTTLQISAAQLAADHDALQALSGYPVIDVAVSGASQTVAGLTNHAVVAVLSGKESQYAIGNSAAGTTLTGNGATITLHDVTAIQFADGQAFIASQLPAAGGAVSSAQVADLYAAVFARTPDAAGLNYYELQAAANPTQPITAYSQQFLQAPEYTANPSHNYAQTPAGDAQFVTDTYANLLHRAPGIGDVAWYQANVITPILGGALPGSAGYGSAELAAHAAILADFSQSSEFLGNVQITAAHTADTQHWLILI